MAGKRSQIEMTKLIVIILMVITVLFVLFFNRQIRVYIMELFNSFFSFLR